MTDIPRYPLTWPTGWKRTPYGQRKRAMCDKWTSAADNMAAIAGHINAIRAVDRYGSPPLSG